MAALAGDGRDQVEVGVVAPTDGNAPPFFPPVRGPWLRGNHADALATHENPSVFVIGRLRRGEERMLWRLVGTGSRRGRALPSRAGDVLRQPVTWAVFAGGLSLSGARGRRAVLRGLTCSAVAAVVQFPFKLVVRRPRPLGARLLRTQRRTSSFPSGHTASDLSFMFAATQEIPLLIAPLSVATLGSHWSLMRSRIHYPSDIIAGGAVAVAVTGAAWKLWPPHARRGRPPALLAAGDRGAPAGEAPHPRKRAVMRFVTNRMLTCLVPGRGGAASATSSNHQPPRGTG